MIDLHTHVLPALDDGATSLDDSVAMLRGLSANGVTIATATPHVRSDYPTTADQMERWRARVHHAVERAGLGIELRPGAEVAFDMLPSLGDDDLRRFALAGNPEFLLVEFPYEGWPPDLASQLVELLDAGVRPVLAHPERNPAVQVAPTRLAPLVGAGVLVQLTASSLFTTRRRKTRSTAHALVDTGLAHIVASDIHSVRGCDSMSKARRALRDERLATWLMVDMPTAVVRRSDTLPARPSIRRRALSLRRR